jgi:hypothetical protein
VLNHLCDNILGCGDSCQWKQAASRHWILRWSADPDGLVIILIFIAGHAIRSFRRFVRLGSLRALLAAIANACNDVCNGNWTVAEAFDAVTFCQFVPSLLLGWGDLFIASTK